MSKSNSSSGGIGFIGLLTILFIGLKLGGVIEWSWWWVLFPAYGPLAIFIGFAGIAWILIKILELAEKTFKKKS